MADEAPDCTFHRANRGRLAGRLPEGALAVVNANDHYPESGDASLPYHPHPDLYYLSGIEQEMSVLLLFPSAADERDREILFLREPRELLATWEGEKLSKKRATAVSGIGNVKWLDELDGSLRRLLAECREVWLNGNEHGRAADAVPDRDARFAARLRERYPLHTYRRLAPELAALRAVKSEPEIEQLRRACAITREGFLRVLGEVRPGVHEHEIEAAWAHAFLSRRGRFAYAPIVASGANSCVLHYTANDRRCEDGDLLLMDVGARHGRYNSDLTRTLPVGGRFSARQRSVYDAVLRVLRAGIAGATAGKPLKQWQEEAERRMNEELLRLGLISKQEIADEQPGRRACRRYFMHGLGHSLGLGVHDVTPASPVFEPGWVLTVEPGIYIPEEGFGIRLENDIVVTDGAPVDLMADIPVEAEEIENLMAAGS